MKLPASLAVALSLFIAAPAFAQDPEPDAAQTSVSAGDTITVTGWRDRALDAFMRGDFVTAEEEFGENLSCIQRQRTLLEWAIQDAIADAGRGNQGISLTISPQQPGEIAERTCFAPEWQLYMMGLSEIQLGRLQEAKYSLGRAARMSNDELMFDAHFRVGLLELLDGNVDLAEQRLRRLRSIQRNCNARGMECEVHADLDVAVAYLDRAVSDARGGTRLR